MEAPEEPLHPRFREIWLRAREDVVQQEEAPPSVVAKIDAAIGGIQAIDPEIDVIRLNARQKVCLLLGAGASASPPSSIPTVLALLPELWRRARKLGREDIDRLASWCEQRNVSNIEDLLTAAYLANFAAKNASISNLLNYFLFREREYDESPRGMYRRPLAGSQIDAASVALFQETLQGLFGLLTGTMIPAQPNAGHDAVVEFIRKHPNSSIVTTNYDGCIDEALLKSSVRFNTHVAEAAETNDGVLDLVKIHGSINWSYCDSCHDVREFDLVQLKHGYESDTITYAVVGICKKCGGQRRPLLIPPMGLKFVMFPNLIRLWNLARDRIEACDYLIVVGFSFSEADSYINKIIERSMSFKEGQVMIICDPNANIARSLRNRYSARIERFNSQRVLSAVGTGDEIVPRVLEMLVAKSDSGVRKSKGKEFEVVESGS